MSLECTLAVRVCVDEFTNVELLSTGHFALECAVSYNGPSGSRKGTPVSCSGAPAALESTCRGVKGAGSDVSERGIVTIDDALFRTRTLRIQYADESFSVGEAATFNVLVRPDFAGRVSILIRLLRSTGQAAAPEFSTIGARTLEVDARIAAHGVALYEPFVFGRDASALAGVFIHALLVHAAFLPPPAPTLALVKAAFTAVRSAPPPVPVTPGSASARFARAALPLAAADALLKLASWAALPASLCEALDPALLGARRTARMVNIEALGAAMKAAWSERSLSIIESAAMQDVPTAFAGALALAAANAATDEHSQPSPTASASAARICAALECSLRAALNWRDADWGGAMTSVLPSAAAAESSDAVNVDFESYAPARFPPCVRAAAQSLLLSANDYESGVRSRTSGVLPPSSLECTDGASVASRLERSRDELSLVWRDARTALVRMPAQRKHALQINFRGRARAKVLSICHVRAAQTLADLGTDDGTIDSAVDVVLTSYAAEGATGATAREAARNPASGLHAVIFVPGLGGHYADLRLVRAAIKTHHPHVLCINARSTEGKVSEGDVVAAGVALADEIADAVDALDRQQRPVTALSIVAFSLGGIFARVAMRTARLSPLIARVGNAFITIATPHLGLPPSKSAQTTAPVRFFESLGRTAGLALVRATGRLRVLEQLSLADGDAASGTAPILERLIHGWDYADVTDSDPLVDARPNAVVLSAFRTVALLASPHDGYAPYRSALAQSIEFWDGLSVRTRVIRAVVHWRGGAEVGGDSAGAEALTSNTAFSLTAVRGAVGAAVLGAYDALSGRAGHTAFLDSEITGNVIALAPEMEDIWAAEGGESK